MTPDLEHFVYCDLKMPLEQGLELLQLITALQDSGEHPGLDQVFTQIERELQASIEFVAAGSPWLGQSAKPKN